MFSDPTPLNCAHIVCLQAALIILLEEKAQAEQRTADATHAAEESVLEKERALNAANEAIRAAEHTADTLKANLERQAAATTDTNIDVNSIVAGAESIVEPVKPATPVNPVETENDVKGHTNLCDNNQESVLDLRRRLYNAYEAVQMAEAKVMMATAERDRINAEAVERETSAAAEARQNAMSAAAEIQRVAYKESTSAKLAAVAAGEQASITEATLRRTESALQTAKRDVEQLKDELERAHAAETMLRVAAEEERGVATGQIAHLENVVKDSATEHERSREKADSNIEKLRATLELSEGASKAADLSDTENATAAPSASANGTPTVAQQLMIPETKDELSGAEMVVIAATGKVDFLRGELMRAKEAEATFEGRREAADTRIAELERSLETAEREHVIFRQGAEERLEKLRASVEDEEQESGAQVCASVDVVYPY